MPQKLLFLVLFACLPAICWGQKNRYTAFFTEIDSINDAAVSLKKLEGFKRKNKLNPTEKIAFYERVFPLAFKISEYDLALKYNFESMKFAREINNDSLLANYLKLTGSTYYYIKDRSTALAYFKKALDIADRNKIWSVKARMLSNIGAMYVEQEKYGLAEKNLKESIALCKKYARDPSLVLLPTRLLATLYTQTGRGNLARPLYEEIISVSDEIKDTSMMCFSRMYFSRLLVESKEFKKALACSEEALKLARIQGNKNTIETSLSGHAQILERTGHLKESIKYLRKTLALRKVLFRDDLKVAIAETEVKYKTGEIRRQKELAESKAVAEKRKNSLYIVVFIGLTLLLIIVFLAVNLRSQSKRKKAEMALQQEYFEAVLEAQEKEKERIARDLHDGICQKFVAARMKFAFVGESLDESGPEISGNYKACIALLDEATNELRNISHEIMPPDLDELGFTEALRQLAHTMFNHVMDYSFEVFGKIRDLSQQEEIQLYRATQELFSNVIRHSKASQVSVQLIFSEKQLMLLVEDDGIGLTESNKKGMGLGNISLRAEIIKARFHMEQPAGRGTLASLKLPLKEHEL
ncbi:MAG: tetratricopeptide repeat protein [Crocinitomicaceae bacterium]|jgi:signal transduction histidine kinase|nr:tetratricopeptide repeat protein [Crocinitomicaceae bacterium]